MAFGRSNSLSINTGATNSLFASQQQTNPSSQPPAAGSLFGSTTQQSTSAGSLFGGPAAAQQTGTNTGGSLFGSTAPTQQRSNSLFAPSQQSGSLFGTAASQPQQTNSLFGNPQSNAPAQQSGGSLFGSTLNSTAQQPQQQAGGMAPFANPQNKPTLSLFGASTTNQSAPAGSSAFGGSTLFGGSNTQQQQPASNSIFGLSAQPAHAPASLLGASQYRSAQYQPFAGKLTMGQNTSAPGSQQPVQGAVKMNFDEMRPTTRFADCVDDIKTQLENIDKMIQNQERFCREIEAFMPKHGQDVTSLAPDVALIKEKAEATENALALDASGVDGQRKILDGDKADFQRCERVVVNLSQPLQYRYVGYGGAHLSTGADGDAAKDMDLVGNYFAPMAVELKKTLDSYASNLSEIEGHMRVIEQSAVAQAQHLASKRAGAGGFGQANGDDTVRELADTLRSFEASILGAAGLVGSCREGVNELILGRLGGSLA